MHEYHWICMYSTCTMSCMWMDMVWCVCVCVCGWVGVGVGVGVWVDGGTARLKVSE